MELKHSLTNDMIELYADSDPQSELPRVYYGDPCGLCAGPGHGVPVTLQIVRDDYPHRVRHHSAGDVIEIYCFRAEVDAVAMGRLCRAALR